MAERRTLVEEERPLGPGAATAPDDFTWGRIVRFGSIVSVILLTANFLVCATAGFFLGVPHWVAWQALPGVVALAFVPATVLRFRTAHPALRVVYAIASTWLGVLNFAFFAAAACWIALGLAWVTGWSMPRVPIAAALFGFAFLTAIYGVINARWSRTRRVTVALPNLPEEWRGRSAALITDLHLGPLSGAAFLRRVLERLRALQPDIVFISGDLFDGPTLGLDALVAPWREFSAPRGIFFVAGNHDEFAERSIYLDVARRVGLRVLENEKVSVGGLQIVGVHDGEAGDPAELRAVLRRAQIDRGQPSVLLAHRPVNLAVAEEAGISLQLSGHTHLGQVWPWNLLVRRIYGAFAYGLNRRGGLQVYTSSGVGTWGPPLRVGTRSEIVVLRFEGAAG